MPRIPSAVTREVRRRAQDACEYCQLPQDADDVPLQVDHILARQHGGKTELKNLALACLHCNLHKGPNLSGIDPTTQQVVALFNPRTDRWAEHFEWNGARLIGLTPPGRATIDVLDINGSIQIAAREALIQEGRFPPDPSSSLNPEP